MTTNKEIQELVDALDGHKRALEAAYRIGKNAAADRVFVSAINARPALKALLAENKRYREALESIADSVAADSGSRRKAMRALDPEEVE